MALYSRIKTWVAGEKLYATDLNNEFNNILSNAKQDKIMPTAGTTPNTAGSMQADLPTGSEGSEQLSTSLLDDIKQLRYVIKQMKNGVNYWYSSRTMLNSTNVDNSTIEVSGGNLRVKANGITASQIANGTITGTQIQDGSIANGDLANSSVTVNTNSPLSGGGAVALGSSLTLGLTSPLSKVYIPVAATYSVDMGDVSGATPGTNIGYLAVADNVNPYKKKIVTVIPTTGYSGVSKIVSDSGTAATVSLRIVSPSTVTKISVTQYGIQAPFCLTYTPGGVTTEVYLTVHSSSGANVSMSGMTILVRDL